MNNRTVSFRLVLVGNIHREGKGTSSNRSKVDIRTKVRKRVHVKGGFDGTTGETFRLTNKFRVESPVLKYVGSVPVINRCPGDY